MDIKLYELAAQTAISRAEIYSEEYKNEFITPEHLLLAIVKQLTFSLACNNINFNANILEAKLRKVIEEFEKVPRGIEVERTQSFLLRELLNRAEQQCNDHIVEIITIRQLLVLFMGLTDCAATYILKTETENVFHKIIEELKKIDEEPNFFFNRFNKTNNNLNEIQEILRKTMFTDLSLNENINMEYEDEKEDWHDYAVDIIKQRKKHNPLIGREREIERTIQVLCRKDKNNPLHIGDAGVGKTSLIYGLAERIAKGDIPQRLKGAKIYQVDISQLLAGASYRGEFEERIKDVMDNILEEKNSIVYIDEIHNIVGAGQVSESSLDASNILKPYLENGDIRFIGATTYEEYNKYFSNNSGIVRRFQQIDIKEPSIEETIQIVKGLKKKYEKHHSVSYPQETIEYAVRASAKYIHNRCLPDKAIDLIDEAGAYREIHPIEGVKTQKIDKSLITDILAKICKVEAKILQEEENNDITTLEERIKAQIFGQDKAAKQLTEAIQMAKAGLLEEDKPLASLLFVGPTGVGKTEIAKVLANELGIELIRFDMSEYSEKHTIAKLIGSPAGYVGYEDGGLLTSAVNKNPNCVLLLDEIEKAHSDIYNVLLQVMDYAKLTDNKGKKTDFRNVVLIMTSNAGAQFAFQANVGFTGSVSKSEAMMRQVKKTFKPEFINRLSGMIAFNDMDKEMAKLILNKKIKGLENKLQTKKVKMTLTKDAEDYLLEKGFTKEYGAREMDRVIAQILKPLLMREILFGKLKKGGKITIDKDMLQING